MKKREDYSVYPVVFLLKNLLKQVESEKMGKS